MANSMNGSSHNHKTPNQPPTEIREALGQSEVFLTFQECLSRVARVDRSVLIIGERGSGKELAAARLHFLSSRWQEPFVALNCAALPASLIESELFGHEEGAFTGAARRRVGRFEASNGGTLFLDEIGNIPIETQEKILRAVEYGAFERVGGSQSVQVDVRIIGATNADLRELVRQERFKSDLLDRLSFEVLFVPPLRERSEDIMLLASHFANRMAYELKLDEMPVFTEGAAQLLEKYQWPGNVRELKNVIERAVYRSDDNLITAEEVVFDPFEPPYASSTAIEPVSPIPGQPEPEPPSRPPSAPSDLLNLPFNEAICQLELRLLRQALRKAQFNQRHAAELLGLTYHQFRGLYRKHQEEIARM